MIILYHKNNVRHYPFVPPGFVGLQKRLPVRLPSGVSPKDRHPASEWKPLWELGKAERTDRPGAGSFVENHFQDSLFLQGMGD